VLTFREINYKDIVNRIELVHIGILPVYVTRELMVNVEEEASRNCDMLNEPSQC
jgi:hypothetical protein